MLILPVKSLDAIITGVTCFDHTHTHTCVQTGRQAGGRAYMQMMAADASCGEDNGGGEL